MANGAIPDKGMAISKAIAIIQEGLRLSLDKEAGGDLAENLDALYEYMGQRLLQANLRNDQAILDEVLELLSGLRDSWSQIDPARTDLPDALVPEQRMAPLSYGKV
jgi:flagellar protein FliS